MNRPPAKVDPGRGAPMSDDTGPRRAQRRPLAGGVWVLSWCLLMVAVAGLNGCAGGSFLAYIFGAGESIPAKYKLQDRDTLILVDDPDYRLGAPHMTNVVANNIRYHLQNQRDADSKFMPTAKLVTLSDLTTAGRLTDQNLSKMTIEDIGSLAQAKQVIYVEVESASLYHETRQVTKPKASVTVKVLDVVERKRLFPAPPKMADSRITPPGYPVVVQLRFDGVDDSGGRGMETVLNQHLAEETGKKVAQVFYDHSKPPPGRSIK